MLAVLVLALLALAPAALAQKNGDGAKTPAAAQALKITRLVISQSEDGPPLESGLLFQPGDVIFFSFQVENYKVGPTGKVQLTGHIQAFDPKGTPIIPPDEEVIGTTLSDEDKEWKPKLRLQIQMPSIAPPGNYRIKYDITDLQTKQTASGESTFPAGGAGVQPATALTIRNTGFYRTQDDATPLKTVAYRAGDILWVRFDITGYKYGEQNAIDVSYDVAVNGPDGKQMFSQENAAVEKSQAYYPQPWVPGAFNLTLQSTMLPGIYTLVLTARDGIGNQSAIVKADFKVE